MKRKLYRMLIPIVGIVCMYSCEQEAAAPNEPSVENEELSKAREIIGGMGFDVSDMSDEGEYYLVEGDIAISKKTLKEQSSPQTRHYSYSGSGRKITTPGDGTQRTIKVGVIDPSNYLGRVQKYIGKDDYDKDVEYYASGQTWLNAIKEAVTEWNTISDFAIKLQWTDNGNNANVIFEPAMINNNERFVGAVGIPHSGSPNAFNTINPKYHGSHKTLPLDVQKQAAVHLLGHVLGFAHADNQLYAFGTEQDVQGIFSMTEQISGTDQYDNLSVMWSENINAPWRGFTSMDKLAAQALYPLIDLEDIPSNVQVSLSQSGNITVNAGTVRSFSIGCNNSDYAIEDIIWSSGGTISGQSTANATVTFNKPGNILVKVAGNLTRDGYYPRPFSFQFNAYVIQTVAPVIATVPPTTSLFQDEQKKFVMKDFVPAFDNHEYVWSVTGGQVLEQNGAEATIVFTELGAQTVTGYAKQTSGSNVYQTAAATYSVTVSRFDIAVNLTVTPNDNSVGPGKTDRSSFGNKWSGVVTLGDSFTASLLSWAAYNNPDFSDVFMGWYVTGTNTLLSREAVYTITMQSPQNIEARFRPFYTVQIFKHEMSGGGTRYKLEINYGGLPYPITFTTGIPDIPTMTIPAYDNQSNYYSTRYPNNHPNLRHSPTNEDNENYYDIEYIEY